MKNEINQWNLHGILINLMPSGDYSWADFFPSENKTVDNVWVGICTIKNDTLIIGQGDEGCGHFEKEDIDKELAKPHWDRSKYFLDLGSCGRRGCLRDCKTGEPINDDAILETVASALGLHVKYPKSEQITTCVLPNSQQEITPDDIPF